MNRTNAVPATITALTAARALQTLAHAGFDWETEARRVGVPVDLTPEFSWRVPVGWVERLFERGIVLLGPDFPLMSRTPCAEENRSPLNLYCRTRQTIREAFVTYGPLWEHATDAYRLTFDDTPSGGVLRWSGVPRPTLWWFDVADMVSSLRSTPAAAPYVTRIRSPFPAPPGAEALFDCPIEPGPSFEAVIPRAVVAARLPPCDPAVRVFIERQIAALEAPAPTCASIVATLWSLGPTTTLADLAATAGTSERTLHRRFAEAGTSFRAELGAMRARLAQGLTRGRSTDEVAVLLGYSDSGAYRRAARRWRMTG